ncbi:MAG: glyoxalase/bleomycin resistance/extradiol dioxygenase family protein [Caldithrix sp.]|nr:glyoxalase/bleomycin resistance/extradiol dioxygenase family protein [Caldithrix sp.]
MKVSDILEVSLYATDLEQAEWFYKEILGLQPFTKEPDRHVFFYCGQRVLLIFNPHVTCIKNEQIPHHGCSGPGHVAFAVRGSQLAAWRTYLQNNGIDIEKEITWPNSARSLYFRDPAGNSIELAEPHIWELDDASFFRNE